jgi:hypothetical protein
MTRKETTQILAILKAAFPASYKGMTKEEANGTITVWSMQFADTPADIVMLAVHKLIAVSKFPPTISEVKDKLHSIHWEAYSAMSDGMRYKNISAQEIKQLERIYELTDGYSGCSKPEPDLHQLCAGGYLQLGSGE